MQFWKTGPYGYELIKGDLVEVKPTHVNHQLIITELVAQLHPLHQTHLKGTLIAGPIALYVSDDTVLLPDLVYLAPENKEALQGTVIMRKADWVCEVLTSETAMYDMEVKPQLYASIGVKEYWIIDPFTLEVEGYTFQNHKTKLHTQAKGIIDSDYLSCLVRIGISFSLKE